MNRFTTLDGVAVPFPRPNIDTDQIIPARFLSRPREQGYGDQLFNDLRYAADGSERADFALNQPAYRPAQIVVAEKNFACGSSREQAVWSLYDYGFRAAIAPSFGDIFGNNALKNGLLPVRLAPEIVADILAQVTENPGARIAIDLPAQTVTAPDGRAHAFDIDPFAKECLVSGLDEIAYTLSMMGEITAFENRYGRENI